ncbi:MAG: hypothetical protein K0B01_13665 [Syntrophobacterales bacterium]|nr:hypothetical protein [Syntrophobacterales bacterium]
MEDIFVSNGLLRELHEASPFSRKIETIHKALNEHFDFIDRISVILFDSKTAILKTFIHSSRDGNPLSFYDYPIKDAPSLSMLVAMGIRLMKSSSILKA